MDLLNSELNLDEITSLFVIVGTLYFVEATPLNMEWRTQLLQRTFNYTDTLSPMHVRDNYAFKKCLFTTTSLLFIYF